MTANQAYNDPRAEQLSAYWDNLSITLSVKDKDEIGVLYLREFLGTLGITDETISRFLAGDFSASDTIGNIHSKIPASTPTRAFWEELIAKYPQVCGPQYLEFLINECGPEGVLAFLFRIGPLRYTNSRVLGLIYNNMDDYL